MTTENHTQNDGAQQLTNEQYNEIIDEVRGPLVNLDCWDDLPQDVRDDLSEFLSWVDNLDKRVPDEGQLVTDGGTPATGAQHEAIDRDAYYGGGKGAKFEALFGEDVYDVLRHATRGMNRVEIAVSDAGMHVSAMDAAHTAGVNVAVEAGAFNVFDVDEAGYLTFEQRLFEAGVSIWSAADVDEDVYEIAATGDGTVDMTLSAHALGATFPTQSRRNDGPPTPDGEEYMDYADTFASPKSREELYQAWADFEGSGGHDDMAELAGEQGCLTFSDGAGGRRVDLHRAGGNSTAYYEAKPVFDVVSNSAHTSVPTLAWGDETPLLSKSASDGVSVEFLVAPRVGVDIESLLCKGADSPEVRPR